MMATVFPLLLGPRKMPVQGTRGTIGSLGCFEVYSRFGNSLTGPMLYPECLVALEAHGLFMECWRRPKTEVDEVDGVDRVGRAFQRAKEKNEKSLDCRAFRAPQVDSINPVNPVNPVNLTA